MEDGAGAGKAVSSKAVSLSGTGWRSVFIRILDSEPTQFKDTFAERFQSVLGIWLSRGQCSDKAVNDARQ